VRSAIIYTCGIWGGARGAGGWAALIREGAEEQILSGGDGETTESHMHLVAVVMALEHLRACPDVIVATPSEYVHCSVRYGIARWIRNGWQTKKGTPVKYQELWRRVIYQEKRHLIRWQLADQDAEDADRERITAAALSAALPYVDPDCGSDEFLRRARAAACAAKYYFPGRRYRRMVGMPELLIDLCRTVAEYLEAVSALPKGKQ